MEGKKGCGDGAVGEKWKTKVELRGGGNQSRMSYMVKWCYAGSAQSIME